MKFQIDDKSVKMWVSGDEFYTTDKNGDGIFHVILSKNIRKQLVGTCDFTVRHCKTDKSKKTKIRSWIKSDEV